MFVDNYTKISHMVFLDNKSLLLIDDFGEAMVGPRRGSLLGKRQFIKKEYDTPQMGNRRTGDPQKREVIIFSENIKREDLNDSELITVYSSH